MFSNQFSYLEIFKKSDQTISETHLDRWSSFLEKIPVDAPEFEKFKNLSLSLSANSENEFGSPELRFSYGQIFQQNGDYKSALDQYVFSDSGQECGEILIKIAKDDTNCENEEKAYDLLQEYVYKFLCQGKYFAASHAVRIFIKKHVEPNSHPTANFLKFLVEACQKGLKDQFMVLVRKSLERA